MIIKLTTLDPEGLREMGWGINRARNIFEAIIYATDRTPIPTHNGIIELNTIIGLDTRTLVIASFFFDLIPTYYSLRSCFRSC